VSQALEETRQELRHKTQQGEEEEEEEEKEEGTMKEAMDG